MISSLYKIIEIEIVFIINLAIQHCAELFPNIKKIPQLFSTLHVTSASPKCIFSVQKRLKTYLRATMNEERLNGVALATINKDEIEYENIEIESRNIDFFYLKIS